MAIRETDDENDGPLTSETRMPKPTLNAATLIIGTLAAFALVGALAWYDAQPCAPISAPLLGPIAAPAFPPGRAEEPLVPGRVTAASEGAEAGAAPAREPVPAITRTPEPARETTRHTPATRPLAITMRTALGEPPRAALRHLDRHQAEALTVVATRERPPRLFEFDDARPVKGSLGRYVIADETGGEETGLLYLDEPPPVHVAAVFHHAVLAWRHVPAGTSHVDLVLPAGALSNALATVHLTVVSAATQEPLAAFVSVRTGDASISGARAGADGEYVVEHLPPGTSLIEAFAPGHRTQRTRVTLQPGEDSGSHTIALEPQTIVKGELLGPRPLPPGIRLEYTSLAGAGHPARVTFPRSDGRCEFTAGNDGPWLVRAVHDASAVAAAGCLPLGSRTIEVDPTGLLEPRFTLALEPATSVVVPRREGLADRLRILDSKGRRLESLALGETDQTIYLVPGHFQVEYACGESRLEVRPLLVETQPIALAPAP